MENRNSNDILELLGIKLDDGKIELDINKTKSFFETMQKTVEKKVEDINSSIKEGTLDLKDSVGLKVENEKIELDLNKTKSFLETIANKAKDFIDSLDSEFENFKKSDEAKDNSKLEQ